MFTVWRVRKQNEDLSTLPSCVSVFKTVTISSRARWYLYPSEDRLSSAFGTTTTLRGREKKEPQLFVVESCWPLVDVYF